MKKLLLIMGVLFAMLLSFAVSAEKKVFDMSKIDIAKIEDSGLKIIDERWILIHKGNDADLYVDMKTLSINDDGNIDAWEMLKYHKPSEKNGVGRSLFKTEYSRNGHRVLAITVYDTEGKALASDNKGNKKYIEWETYVPGTVIESIYTDFYERILNDYKGRKRKKK